MPIDRAAAIAAIQNLPEAASPAAGAPTDAIDLMKLVDFEIEKTYRRRTASGAPNVISVNFPLPAGVTVKSVHATAGSVVKDAAGWKFTPPQDATQFVIVAAKCSDGLNRADFCMITG